MEEDRNTIDGDRFNFILVIAHKHTETHLDVFVGLELADVLLQKQQVERQVVPVAFRLGQHPHSGQQLVDLQEMGGAAAQQGAQAGVDHHGDQGHKDYQVHQAEEGEGGNETTAFENSINANK